MDINKRDLLVQTSAILMAGCATAPNNNDKNIINADSVFKKFLNIPKYSRPLIIAHRGASGYRPEHTIAAYELAVEMGADFIEPDLVFTKDGHLVCRHENNIDETTNVAQHPEFSDRKTSKVIDGQKLNGWFTEDFTLAELKTLRCKERLPQLRPNNTKYDNQYQILTFEEILRLRVELSEKYNRTIGVYPETKHPSYFLSIGYDYEKPLLDALSEYGLNHRQSPVFIQSFESENLKLLKSKTEVKLIQLMSAKGGAWDTQSTISKTYDYMQSIAGLEEIAEYSFGIGPEKAMILDNIAIKPSALVGNAHKVGLGVHPWTFRVENYFLPENYRIGDKNDPRYLALHGNVTAEMKACLAAGIDGLFSDFPDLAFQSVKELAKIK